MPSTESQNPIFGWTNKYLKAANFRTQVKGDFSDPNTAPVISCEADVCSASEPPRFSTRDAAG
jgi:hypothetical protein